MPALLDPFDSCWAPVSIDGVLKQPVKRCNRVQPTRAVTADVHLAQGALERRYRRAAAQLSHRFPRHRRNMIVGPPERASRANGMVPEISAYR